METLICNTLSVPSNSCAYGNQLILSTLITRQLVTISLVCKSTRNFIIQISLAMRASDAVTLCDFIYLLFRPNTFILNIN